MRRRTALAETNLLELAPRRTVGWSEEEGFVVVRPEPPARPWRAPRRWLRYQLATKAVRLDEVGSFAWLRLDGRTTVAEVAADLRAEFGERVEPAEERLGMLVRMLRRADFIDYGERGESAAEATLRPR